MAASNQEMAKDIVVAWLNKRELTVDAGKTGEWIGTVYKAVVRAIEESYRSPQT